MCDAWREAVGGLDHGGECRLLAAPDALPVLLQWWAGLDELPEGGEPDLTRMSGIVGRGVGGAGRQEPVLQSAQKIGVGVAALDRAEERAGELFGLVEDQ